MNEYDLKNGINFFECMVKKNVNVVSKKFPLWLKRSIFVRKI